MSRITNFLSKMLIPSLLMLIIFVIIASFSWKLAFNEPVPEFAAFDTNLYYSPDSVLEKYQWYSPEQRKLYVSNAFTFDLAFPILYVLLLLTVCAFFIKRLKQPKWLMVIYILPLLTGILDIAENITVSYIMLQGVGKTSALLASTLTATKWIFLYISIGVIGLLFATYCYTIIREKIAGQKP
ncbi:MAG TPA: hypothetical protein P5519_01020 [Spirochaetia bacterium]|nr:hypothetical protein [Spirochaetales bacterium]HRS64452.1 hypothetical protein [Spirochaetia bacterium]HOT59507.1 hypothetical protein [Spirochaetales bacterium]HPD79597.1 hypothetical protein [Spirochaetales bacterium]HQG39786.1 hypothetical protein [Spirochaetales bacterium]